jgi:uncharacterized protein (TIGR02246 family)
MRQFLLLAGVLSLAGCQPTAEPPPEEAAAPAPMSDEDMLRARTDEFELAVSKGDVKAIGALFVEDGDLVDQAGVMHHGRAAIEERYQKLFEGPYKGAQANLEIGQVRFVRPDIAVIDGTYELNGMKSPDGLPLGMLTGLFTNVSVKQNGEWMLHCSRPMLPIKAPGT